jgi:TetR/AcrR family transcriptional regulator
VAKKGLEVDDAVLEAGRPPKYSPGRAQGVDSARKGKKVPVQTMRDTDMTRENILRQATKEFSQHGFDGARVDRIAERCRLSKNTLYYHFGSKDGLISAVLENIYQQLRNRQEQQVLNIDDPVKAMQQIVNQTFQAFIDIPAIIPLLNEENLHKGVHVKNQKWLKNLYDPLLAKIENVLNSGAVREKFRKDIDPVLIYLTISSMAYHFISNSHTLQIALGRSLSSQEAKDGWAAHIRETVIIYCSRN